VRESVILILIDTYLFTEKKKNEIGEMKLLLIRKGNGIGWEM
jgi:hypothetical protein